MMARWTEEPKRPGKKKPRGKEKARVQSVVIPDWPSKSESESENVKA